MEVAVRSAQQNASVLLLLSFWDVMSGWMMRGAG